MSVLGYQNIEKGLELLFFWELKEKARINDYWTVNPLKENPAFWKTMSRNRFRQILSCFNFSDKNNKLVNADKNFKV